MHAILGSMIWIKQSALTEVAKAKFQKALTFQPISSFGGEPLAPVLGYTETPEWFGVPRGLKDHFTTEERTVCDGIKWPPMAGVLRPGQAKSVEELVKFYSSGGRDGRLEAKCGAGKSISALTVAARLGLRLLVLIHKEDLASNWRNDAHKMFPGVTIGHVQGDTWQYGGAHVTTCMAQTLWARKGRYPEGFLKSFDMVVVDEGHRFAAQIFEYCLRVFPARYRLGVSATWRRRDGLEVFFKLHLGQVVSTMASNHLVGKYIMIPCRLRVNIPPKMPWARKLNTLAQSGEYTLWMAREIAKAVIEHDRKVLVVSDRISQLQALQQALTVIFQADHSNRTSGLFIGKVDKAEQDEARKADVVLATYAMICEGTDIPALDTLFVASPRSDMEQTVGRIQRKYDGKKSLLIVDPYVVVDRMMVRTAEKREGWYRKLGFEALRVKRVG